MFFTSAKQLASMGGSDMNTKKIEWKLIHSHVQMTIMIKNTTNGFIITDQSMVRAIPLSLNHCAAHFIT